jgi:hypothetical protein
MQKKIDELEKDPYKTGHLNENPMILRYLINQDGIISKICQNQHKNQLYIEFLSVSIFKDGESPFLDVGDTADYLRSIA